MLETIINRVRMVHVYHPELRFQQIMTIAAQKAGWKDNDLFYCPDSTIEEGLSLMLEEINNKG